MSLSNQLIFICVSVGLVISCSPNKQQADEKKEVSYASFGGSPIDEAEERKYTLMEREIEYLMDIWEGDYDNVEQLSFESDRGMKDSDQGQHLRIHSTISKFTNDQLGEYLLHVKEYKNNSPNDIFRHYVYKLIPEDSTKEIRVEVYKFKSSIDNDDPIKLSKLKMSSIEKVNDCDIWIHREGKTFVGHTGGASCGSAIDDSSSYTYHVKIAKDLYGFRYTQNASSSGQSPTNENWYLLDKSRCFVCMIDFPREEGGRPVETKHYIEIHDQGGQFDFDYLDGRHMVLTMRNTWSYGMKRNTFVIVLQEENLKGKVLIYAWGQDEADRIGMNPGWIRVQCDLKDGKNTDLQQRLRPDS